MLILENIRLALFSLKANKMRALLTMLGIIIGIASVIAIMTVGNSITSSLNSTLSSIGATNITVYVQQRQTETETDESGLEFSDDASRQKKMTEDDYFTDEMISKYCETYKDDILAISASQSVGSGQIVDGKKYANISLTGVSLGYFSANSSYEVKHGRYFTDSEISGGSQSAIISDKSVNNIFGEDADPDEVLGSSIQVSVNDKTYNMMVIGIYDYDTSMSFSTTNEKDISTDIFIPLSTAQEMVHTYGYPSFTVAAKPTTDANEFASKTKSFFSTYYRNNRNYEPAAYSLSSMLDSLNSLMKTITTAISVIAGIALLVGGIGVMNIMLVSITERTREIGTRKALGAPSSSIRLQFIIESVVICIIGGIIGIILGIILGAVAAKILKSTLEISTSSIILSISFSTAIGIFFGYYPANKAAKMDPIEALRYE